MTKYFGLKIPKEKQFDQICNLAGIFLENDTVCQWVANRFPIIVLDEAQDLKPERLRMIKALSNRIDMIFAADEFQCLDETLRPNPTLSWIQESLNLTELTQNFRTDIIGIINASHSIRLECYSRENNLPDFRIYIKPSRGNNYSYPASQLGFSILNKSLGNFVVLTPSRNGGYADGIIRRIGESSIGQRKIGPYIITWEKNEVEMYNKLVERNKPEYFKLE